MKQNILEWVGGRMTDATGAIVLTHNIDFLFIQSILLPRLQRIGYPKLTIFADVSCAANTYQQQEKLLSGLGRNHRVVLVDMGVGRRFHPKAILLTGPTKASLAVGSGNLTHGGWSANKEIWSGYESDGEGAAAISAFKAYLETVQRLSGDDPTTRREIEDAFDALANPWVSNLPEPSGLIGTPDDRPILDRVFEVAGGGIERATVFAPYHDPDGAALREIADRLGGAVTCYTQKGHVGLSTEAAHKTPENVKILSVDTDPSRFAHAKIYAFYQGEGATLVCGSANISRAALLSDGTWGNAELVAIDHATDEEVAEVFNELIVQDSPPEFPETPPSDEWEVIHTPIRILKVSYLDGVLGVSFKADASVEMLELLVDDEPGREFQDLFKQTEIRTNFAQCPRSIRLQVRFVDGREEVSAPMWVNNENALNKPVPERRIAAKLAESMNGGMLSATGMLEIFQLLNQHLRSPVGKSHGAHPREGYEKATGGQSYSADEVFSDGFGQSVSTPFPKAPGGFSESDFFKTFMSYFSFHETDGEHPEGGSVHPVEPEPDGAEGDEVTNEAPLDERAKWLKQRDEVQRLRKRLLSALDMVAEAMASDEFLEGRSPDRFGSDIAATALLLRKGLNDRILSTEDFTEVSGKLWTVLFFGLKGHPSLLEKLSERLVDAEQAGQLKAIASPKLSAALTLWCLPNWDVGDLETVQFRFSAMLLSARFPWLVAGGEPEDVQVELRRLARSLNIDAGYDALNVAWVQWLRVGIAFAGFEESAQKSTPKDLAQKIVSDEVRAGELLWQAGELCVSEIGYKRAPNVHAIVHPLKGGAQKKIKGDWLVPVKELVQLKGALDMHPKARDYMVSIISEVEGLSEV